MSSEELTQQAEAEPDPRRTSKTVRDRAATESRLLHVARGLVERDGLLAGVSLLDVARESKVNRGQIYQYFGSRQKLLREALRQASWWPGEADIDWDEIFRLPFYDRRSRLFKLAIEYATFLKLGTILVLDRDPEAKIFPMSKRQVAASKRDQRKGNLREDLDPAAAHIMTVCAYLGYAVFREQFASEFELPLDDLDQKAFTAYNAMLKGLTTQ